MQFRLASFFFFDKKKGKLQPKVSNTTKIEKSERERESIYLQFSFLIIHYSQVIYNNIRMKHKSCFSSVQHMYIQESYPIHTSHPFIFYFFFSFFIKFHKPKSFFRFRYFNWTFSR